MRTMLILGIPMALIPVSVLAQGPADKAPALPPNVSGWSLAAEPAGYDAQTVFDYMDGFAEEYLVYAFAGLRVAYYRRGGAELVVEIYDMSRSQEAFGVFSTHLDGDSQKVGQDCAAGDSELWFWQGKYFCRIFESKRRTGLRQDMLTLARAVAQTLGPPGERPDLLTWLPTGKLEYANVRYFHDDGNLNRFHYVSTENVLHLSKETDCVLACIRWPDGPRDAASMPKLLLVRYPSVETRDQAWQDLCRKVLCVPEAEIKGTTTTPDADKIPVAFRYTRGTTPLLALCLPAPDGDPRFAEFVKVVAAHIM